MPELKIILDSQDGLSDGALLPVANSDSYPCCLSLIAGRGKYLYLWLLPFLEHHLIKALFGFLYKSYFMCMLSFVKVCLVQSLNCASTIPAGVTVRVPQTTAYVVNNGLTLGSGAPQLTVHHRPPQVHAVSTVTPLFCNYHCADVTICRSVAASKVRKLLVVWMCIVDSTHSIQVVTITLLLLLQQLLTRGIVAM